MESQIERNHPEPDGGTCTMRFEHGLSSSHPLYTEGPFIFSPPSCPLICDYHHGIEVGIVIEGQMLRRFNDLSYVAGPGDVWLCATWEPHEFARGAGANYILFVFLPEFLGDESFDGVSWLSLFAVPPRERPRVTIDEMRREILAIGRELAREISDKPRAWTTGVRLNLLKIFLLMMRDWEPTSLSQPTRELRASDLSLIAPSLEILHSDPTRSVKISEAAKACGLGETTFGRKFQNAMGMGFHRFQLRAKLGFAAKHLMATDLSIEAIAAEAGFVDSSHMVHAFSKYYGCTPSQYRRRPRFTSNESQRDFSPLRALVRI